MSQTSSSPPTTATSTSVASAEPPVSVLSWVHVLISAAICLVLGLGLYWLHGRIDRQAMVANANREHQDKLQEDFSTSQAYFEASQSELRAALEKAHEEKDALRQRLTALEEKETANQQRLDLLRQETSKREAAQARSLAHTSALLAAGANVHQRLEQLKRQTSEWARDRVSLATDDRGKRIAAVSDRLPLLVPVFHRRLPAEQELQSWQDRLATLLAPAKKAHESGDGNTLFDDEHAQAIEDLGEEISNALEILDRDRRIIAGVLRDSATVQPAETTLEDALVQAEEAMALDFQRQVNEHRKSALGPSAAALGKARAAKDVAQAVLEAERLKTETEHSLAKARQEQLARRYQAALPEIQTYLRPFITSGYAQPQGHIMMHATKPGPVSFSALKASGALKDDRAGMTRLMYLATMNNDRASGSFPKYNGSERGWQQTDKSYLRKAQSLLTEFGPMMVNKGLLSP